MGNRAGDASYCQDISRRQILLLAAGGGTGAIAGCNSINETSTSDSSYDSEVVQAHVRTAAEQFDQNYQLLTSSELSSPASLYSLDIKQIDENLDVATEEINTAKEVVGDSSSTLVTEANEYLLYQQRLRSAFEMPEGKAGEYIIDDQLETVIEAAKQRKDASQEISPEDYERDPYNIDRQGSLVQRGKSLLPFEEFGKLLSHEASDLIGAAQAGIQTVSDIGTLYQMLRAHALVPWLDEDIFEIDRRVSQTTSPEDIALEWEDQFGVNLDIAGVAQEGEISDGIASKRIGQESFTAGEIQQAHSKLVAAFDNFETSITALVNGRHEESTTHWSQGLEDRYVAQERNPLQ